MFSIIFYTKIVVYRFKVFNETVLINQNLTSPTVTWTECLNLVGSDKPAYDIMKLQKLKSVCGLFAYGCQILYIFINLY